MTIQQDAQVRFFMIRNMRQNTCSRRVLSCRIKNCNPAIIHGIKQLGLPTVFDVLSESDNDENGDYREAATQDDMDNW